MDSCDYNGYIFIKLPILGPIVLGVALCLSGGGHMTNLTYKKKCIYILAKKKLYTKLTYCDNYNKNVEYPYLKITKIWVR